MYTITKLFIGGTLKGLAYVETTNIPYAIGYTCKKPIGGSPYTIIAITKNAN